MIKAFIQRYKVNMAEAAQPDPEKYESFNQFFTRQLAPELRPIAANSQEISCPCDGEISEFGQIKQDSLLQAKNHSYRLVELLGGDAEKAALFENGSFATFYLAPKDYHRVHIPIDGALQQMSHLPGKLFSVNLRTANTVPNLFARNERVITIFQTAAGTMAVILVGAMIVASIGTSWAGLITPPFRKTIRHWKYDDVFLKKGDELGYFQLGSTAIVLFQANSVDWQEKLVVGQSVKMGQTIARLR